MTLEFQTAPGFLIRRLHQISVSVFEQELAAAGIDLTPVQFAALSAIDSYPGIDQATLAGLIAYDRVTIGGVVDRLVARGLVARRVNKNDRRSRKLSLTTTGKAEARCALPLVLGLQGRILAGLSAQERRLFQRLLTKTADAGNANSRAPLRALEGGELP